MSIINRLRGTRCYLSGAMDRVPDGGIGWRQEITPFLKSLGIYILDPCDKPTEQYKEDPKVRKYIHKCKTEGNFNEVRRFYKPIRGIDLRMVDVSDFIIVNLDLNIHPCGTYEELFLGNRQKKPIIIRCEQGKRQIPNWLFGTLPHRFFFTTWNGVVHYLKQVNSSKKIKTYNRWYFFQGIYNG